MELEALQEVLPELEATGASLIAISPLLEKYSSQLVKKLGLTFPVLSDPGSKVLKQFGILFPLPADLIEVYKGFGIDLERFNGEDKWQLPLAGRIIIDSDGTVLNTQFSVDHTERPEPLEVVDFLNNL